jgi:hypothetical protein
MPLATLIHRASLPSPQVSAEQARQWLAEHYGLSGTLQALGSQQDLNYRVDSPRGRFVLKICRGDYALVELQAQHAGLKYLAEHAAVTVPRYLSINWAHSRGERRKSMGVMLTTSAPTCIGTDRKPTMPMSWNSGSQLTITSVSSEYSMRSIMAYALT